MEDVLFRTCSVLRSQTRSDLRNTMALPWRESETHNGDGDR